VLGGWGAGGARGGGDGEQQMGEVGGWDGRPLRTYGPGSAQCTAAQAQC
jgi:hypothetical protein